MFILNKKKSSIRIRIFCFSIIGYYQLKRVACALFEMYLQQSIINKTPPHIRTNLHQPALQHLVDEVPHATAAPKHASHEHRFLGCGKHRARSILHQTRLADHYGAGVHHVARPQHDTAGGQTGLAGHDGAGVRHQVQSQAEQQQA